MGDMALPSDRAGGANAPELLAASQPEALIPSAGFDWYRLLPRYWFQNDPTDRLWDAALNRALNHFDPVLGYKTVSVGPFNVWVANWPYAYGSREGRTVSGLPLVRTRLRLFKAVAMEELRGLASAIEARTAETQSGSVHESTVPAQQGDAQPQDHSS